MAKIQLDPTDFFQNEAPQRIFNCVTLPEDQKMFQTKLLEELNPIIDKDHVLRIISFYVINEANSIYRCTSLLNNLSMEGFEATYENGRFIDALNTDSRISEPAFLLNLEAGPTPPSLIFKYKSKFQCRDIFTGAKSARVVIPNSKLAIYHAKQSSDSIRVAFPTDWFDLVRFETSKPSNVLRNFIRTLLNAFAHLPNYQYVLIHDYFNSIVPRAYDAVIAYLESVEQAQVPTELWCGSSSSVWVKMLKYLVYNAGGTVISHDHAYPGIFHQSVSPDNFLFESQYVTHSDAAAQKLSSHMRRLTACRHEYPSIIGMDGYMSAHGIRYPEKIFSNLLSRISRLRHSRPDALQSVLYIPTLYEVERSRFVPMIPSVIYLDWQARMIQYLKNDCGLHVYISPHPEGEGSLPTEFESEVGVHVINRPVEEILHVGDVAIFDWPCTTTFGLLLASNKPIVMFDFDLVDWDSAVREMLMRRVRFVESWFDHQHRAQTQWANINQAIKESLNLDDRTYVRKYISA